MLFCYLIKRKAVSKHVEQIYVEIDLPIAPRRISRNLIIEEQTFTPSYLSSKGTRFSLNHKQLILN